MENEAVVMRIKRIDSDKIVNAWVKRVVISLGEREYTLTPDIRGLLIHRDAGEAIWVRPVCANEIIIK